MSESLNNAEKEYASVEDLLGMHRSVSNETAFFLRFQTYLMRKMLLLHQDKEKTFNFKQHFLIFFLRVNLAIMFLEMF